MDGGHGARAPFAHPTEPISNSVIGKHSFAISPQLRARFDLEFPTLSQQRAQGRPGASAHPRSACIKSSTRQNHRCGQIIRPSLRNGFTAYFALSPGTGLFCPRHFLRNCFPRKLSASVGAPGPHAFAVRFERRRLQRHQRPPHPASRP